MSLPRHADVLSGCPWIPAFRSDDLDDVRQFFGDVGGSRARVAHARQPMGCVARRVGGVHMSLGNTQSAVGQTARWLAGGTVFQLAVPPGSTYLAGRHVSALTGPTDVVMLPAAWEWSRSSPAGGVLALMVQPSALEDELRALQPATDGTLPHRMVARTLDPAHHARLVASAAAVAQATRPGTDPRQLRLAEARMRAEAAALLPAARQPAARAEIGEERMRSLEAWIDANLAEPITLGALCRVADVGARSLQRAFVRRRGVSPMRFVVERRLVATHRALLRASPGASVTDIALGHGFDHVGRFAQLYRQVFGELPSRTLAGHRGA